MIQKMCTKYNVASFKTLNINKRNTTPVKEAFLIIDQKALPDFDILQVSVL
jgi:hypothetical protein